MPGVRLVTDGTLWFNLEYAKIIEVEHAEYARLVEVKDIVSEAMAGLEDVMTELDDMQFQFRMGQDNRVNLSYDDTTFELDLDQIMAQVATAVEIGLSEINTGQWTDSRHRWNHVAAEDLESELDELRSEMRELRAELRKLRNQNSD